MAAALAVAIGASCAVASARAQDCPGNPDALGTSRVLAIDPADYPRLGRMQYPDSLPLADKEVVLTFDDGPLPPYSNQILDILAAECVKATYFLVGTMARAYPAVARRVYQEGHTIGTHSDHHPIRFSRLPIEKLRQEIDGGIADVAAALGDGTELAPFFRIPGLDRSGLVESELAARGLVVFSSDTVADDWHHRIKPAQIISLALSRLEARGKGILLLHDIHAVTVAALPGLLKELKDKGFRVVQVVPAPSDRIEVAGKSKLWMLASAMPEALTLDDGGTEPSWPATTASTDATEAAAVDDSALPAPDASAFEAGPQTALAFAPDNGEVQWPDRPQSRASQESNAASSEPEADAPSAKKTARHHRAAADSEDHDRARGERHHAHAHARAHNDGKHADLVSRIKSVASMMTPAR